MALPDDGNINQKLLQLHPSSCSSQLGLLSPLPHTHTQPPWPWATPFLPQFSHELNAHLHLPSASASAQLQLQRAAGPWAAAMLHCTRWLPRPGHCYVTILDRCLHTELHRHHFNLPYFHEEKLVLLLKKILKYAKKTL